MQRLLRGAFDWAGHGHGVTLSEAFRVWLRVALLSFGGPGTKSWSRRREWVSENRFLHALNYCMLLPGPEVQQLATYIGWLMHCTLGGNMAGGRFVLPGMVCGALHRRSQALTGGAQSMRSEVQSGAETRPLSATRCASGVSPRAQIRGERFTRHCRSH